MNKRFLNVLVATMVDYVHGSVGDHPNHINGLLDDLGLSEKQAKAAIGIATQVGKDGDWQFEDDSDEYNLHVVRQFVYSFCDGTFEGSTPVLYEMTGEKLEEFIVKLQELVK